MINNVMIDFEYNYILVFMITLCAASISSIFNYLFGVVLLKIYRNYAETDKCQNGNSYLEWQKYTAQYGLEYFIICNVIPGLGNIIGVIFGFLRTNIWRFIIYVLLSRVVFYYIVL